MSIDYPRLRTSGESIDRLFFFYDHWLHGELDLSHYKLSEEGRAYLQREFATYSTKLQNRLRELTGRVWQYSKD